MVTDFRLKVFRVAAERLSFTRAAEELFISQPAVYFARRFYAVHALRFNFACCQV